MSYADNCKVPSKHHKRVERAQSRQHHKGRRRHGKFLARRADGRALAEAKDAAVRGANKHVPYRHRGRDLLSAGIGPAELRTGGDSEGI